MSKRTLILIGVAVLAIIGAFLSYKYETEKEVIELEDEQTKSDQTAAAKTE
jgi:hypothetical protein